MYGLKYVCNFDPIDELADSPVYIIEILQKNYTGQVFNITGSTIPALQNWDTDDPKAPIKGCSLAMAFLNIDGALPLSSFFSTEDDTFMVRLSFSKSTTETNTEVINVVPLTMGRTSVTIHAVLPTDGAKYFILDGIKYQIISISTDGTNTYLTTYGTPVIINTEKIFSISYEFNAILFAGFLVQDDCSEVLLDYTHEINLSANDGLGLLKDISLEKANTFSLSYTSDLVVFGADFNTRTFLFDTTIQPYILVGDRIEITGGTRVDGIYTINRIIIADTGTLIYVDEPLPDNSNSEMTIYKIYTPSNLLDKTPLITILRMCLSVTGLELNTNIYSKISEVSQDATRSFLEQTLINPQSFLNNDTDYMNCYDILTQIMARFNMSIFQANGVWNVVRWDELRYYSNLIQGYSYDSEFNFLGNVTLPAALITGVNESTKALTGILQKINRPFLYDKETFNYKQPKQLLRNFDLQLLGTQIRSYTKTVWITPDGVVHDTPPGGPGVITSFQKINEYNAPYWYTMIVRGWSPPHSPAVFFIRVITDDLDNELERYFVIVTPPGYAAMSYQIEANKGDIFTFSCSIRTTQSIPGNAAIGIWALIDDGTNPVMSLVGGTDDNTGTTSNTWLNSTNGWSRYLSSTTNSNQWNSISINTKTAPIPFDGFLYICPKPSVSTPGFETQFKDIRFEYSAVINQSTKIIGQTHQQSQAGIIKNNEEIEIFMDDSPRNSIAGALFLNEKIGLLQKKTSLWMHPSTAGIKKRLGDLITFEQLFWRRKPRTILEGTLYGLIPQENHISLLSVLEYNFFSDLNFVFGKLEIDYKTNKLDCTLWEVWQDGETDADLPSEYAFNYIYSTT